MIEFHYGFDGLILNVNSLVISEQSIRDNFILLYELVDEYFDNGYVQIPSVNDLMQLNVIYNQPTLDHLSEIWNLLLTADLIASHTDSSRHRSHNTAISSFAPPPHPTSTVIESADKNQIFVDIVEYINVTSQSFYYRRNHLIDDNGSTSNHHHHHSNSNGYLHFNQSPIVQTSSIHGTVSMKVFLNDPSSSESDANRKLKNGKITKNTLKTQKSRKRKRRKFKFGKKSKDDDDVTNHDLASISNTMSPSKHSHSNGPTPSSTSISMTAEEDAMEYLSSLAPGIRLQFNDDLVIGRQNAPPYNKIFGALILDDVSFHQKVICSQPEIEAICTKKQKLLNLPTKHHHHHHRDVSFIDNFAKKKILKFFLPNGEEFEIMNYRITSSFRDGSNANGSKSNRGSRRNSPRESDRNNSSSFSYDVPPSQSDPIRIPFRIVPYFNVVQGAGHSLTVPIIEFFLKIRADYPKQCVGRDVILEFNVPNCVSTVTLQTKTGHRANPHPHSSSRESGSKNKRHKGPAMAPPSAPGVGSTIPRDIGMGPSSNIDSKRDSKMGSLHSLLSDKELASIKQDVECVSIRQNGSAFGIDLSADDLSENIGIGKRRQMDPERCSRKVVWRMNTFPSGIEQILRCKFTLNYHHHLTEQLLLEKEPHSEDDEEEDGTESECKSNGLRSGSIGSSGSGTSGKYFDLHRFRKMVSPIAMKFQIDNYNVSGLDIRSLRCIDWTSQRDDGGSNNGTYTTYRPYRWVRRITRSGSYICRL